MTRGDTALDAVRAEVVAMIRTELAVEGDAGFVSNFYVRRLLDAYDVAQAEIARLKQEMQR